ncbi:MAG: hypothetical protein KAR42_01465 [candidate division Zixibacteria bacterium]|nr:hypothetical protein [candidate division Zixibacteria bacterium]
MNPQANYLRIGVLAILILALAVQPSEAKVFKWQDSSGNSKDLLLLGFSEITMQSFKITGNKSAFLSSNPNLQEDFFANYRASIFANGNMFGDFKINGAVIVDSRIDDEYRTNDPSVFRLRMSVETTEPLWDGWRFTGKGVYDPNRQWELENLDTRLLTQPQEPALMELLMRLESDKYGLVEGGSIRPSFKGSKFSLNQRSLFGGYANLHSENERVGAEMVGGKLEGKSYRQGATTTGTRADGTTGPFDMDQAPVTRGSEEVKVEVRDRFDETTVISSKKLMRDIDYTVDYLRGRITLHQPIASETISSDPVYIVITYDYLRNDNDEILGGRAKLAPINEVRVSGTYLKRFMDDNASGDGVDEPEYLSGADMNFNIKEHTTGYFEYGGAENPNSDLIYNAYRAGAETNVISNLRVNFDFQEIEDQFRSFTNSDLDPNKNQMRFQLGGVYDLTSSQKATANFLRTRGLERNGEFNSYDGILEQKVYLLGYHNDLSEEFGFGVKVERREKEDRENLAHEDNYQNRGIANIGGTFTDFGFFGDFGYDAKYELIQFRNQIQIGDDNYNTNQFAVTLTSKPGENSNFKLGQRFTAKKETESKLYTERQDATFGSAQVRLHENLNILSTGEYKRYTTPDSSLSLWQDNPNRIAWAGTFAVEYLPLEKIKAFGKVSRHDNHSWPKDTTANHTVTDFLQSQLTYFHTHHLSASVENELRQTVQYTSVIKRKKVWELGARLNWNKDRLNEFTAGMIRKWQKHDYYPSEAITATSYIMLASGSVSMTHGFFLRGSIKQILVGDPEVENAITNSTDYRDTKTFTKIELGFDNNDWYRLSLGYEQIESDYDDPDQSLRNYTGKGFFVRFSGKL